MGPAVVNDDDRLEPTPGRARAKMESRALGLAEEEAEAAPEVGDACGATASFPLVPSNCTNRRR